METILVNQQYFDIDGLEQISSKHMIAMLGDDEYAVVLPSVDESPDGITARSHPRGQRSLA
eukprot:780703-Prymnesium_polylepis.1